MYLNLLKEKEKKLFIGIAHNLAVSDGDYSDKENIVINSYCQEMHILFDEKNVVKSVVDIAREIAENSSDKVKKIFIFELIGLAMIDGNYDENERTLIKQMEDIFHIDTGYADKCEQVITEYIAFQGKINQIVLG